MANEPREMTARERSTAIEQTAKDLMLTLSNAEEQASKLTDLLDLEGAADWEDIDLMAEELDNMYNHIDNVIFGGP